MDWLRRMTGEGQDRGARSGGQPASDEEAIRRYRYLLRTAPPEAIEQAHAEAFAQLTPDQRARVLRGLSAELPEYERNAAGDDPKGLARLATRAEMRRPGSVERALGGFGGPSMGGIVAGSLLASVAGAFIGTAIAESLFDQDVADQESYTDEVDADQEGSFDEGGGFDAGGDFGEL
jgi:hypothetical protein